MKTNILYLKSSESMSEVDDASVDLIVTSPPYNIDIHYGNSQKKGKIVGAKGVKYKDDLEEEEYRELLRKVFTECKRILKDTGSICVNIKNRYSNGVILPPFWIQDYFEDFYLKNIIIWNFDWGGSTNKRFAPRYEYVFWFAKKSDGYKFNLDSVKIPAQNYRPDRYKSQMKNPTDVWKIPMISGNFLERTEHPAQYPEKLIERIVLAFTDRGDVVLDPFMGSGTTAAVAKKKGRKYIGYEIVPEYNNIAENRLKNCKEENNDD